MQVSGYELLRIHLLSTWMNKGKKKGRSYDARPFVIPRAGLGLLPPPRLLAVHSPTRSAVPRSSNPAVTNSGLVRMNVNIEPSGAMN
jgi:hypothetical protein